MVKCKKSVASARPGPWGRFISFLAILLLVAACSPAAKSDEEVRREVQDLKKEVKALQEKLDQLQAGQKAILDSLAKAPQPGVAVMPEQPSTAEPSGPQPLTVSQLLAGKDQYLGTRVTVKGQVGPVLVHHKSLILKAPDGMVEVLFGKLPDEKMVQRLTSVPLEQPVTVTGLVSLPPRAGAAKLQINAEAIDF